jgi:NCAIR mutase (PurE)-related protein
MIRSRTKTSIKPTVHHGRDGYHPSRSGIAAVQHFARLDLHRKERTGVPEAVFAMNKTTEQVVSILDKLARQSGQALATRVSDECAKTMRKKLGRIFQVEHNASGGTVLVRRRDFKPSRAGGRIAVLAAGTADIRVAEEARVTAELMGCEVLKFYDVGIAGIHRLAEPLKQIAESEVSCLVVAAGMEGALPSVVRGLVDVPVIGVPVSTGYGHGGKGEAALMTMLQSCSPGLTVVNIDNGFGAGATAALIANRVAAKS